MAQFKELLVFGTTRILDNVYAKKFIGNLEGTADRAIADKNGKDITTYISSITGDGNSTTIVYTLGDGSTASFVTQDTHVEVVDNLSSTATDAALSAAQGKSLKDTLDEATAALTWGEFVSA